MLSEKMKDDEDEEACCGEDLVLIMIMDCREDEEAWWRRWSVKSKKEYIESGYGDGDILCLFW